MSVWELLGYSTEDHGERSVRHREYTTSERKATLFAQIPRIDFTDSGHGICFVAIPHAGKRKPERYMASVAQQVERLRSQSAAKPPARSERIQSPCPACGSTTLFVADGYLTCGLLGDRDGKGGCPDPCAADDVLRTAAEHAARVRRARAIVAADDAARARP